MNTCPGFKLHVAAFRGDFDASQLPLAAVLTWVGGERQKILVLQRHPELVYVRIDANRRPITGEKRVAARAVANSIQIALPDVTHTPASARPSGGRFVDRMNQDPSLLRFVDCALARLG